MNGEVAIAVYGFQVVCSRKGRVCGENTASFSGYWSEKLYTELLITRIDTYCMYMSRNKATVGFDM